jgi:hypothetical protein
MSEKKEQAITMRRLGSTYDEIENLLGCPRGTLASWFKDLVLTDETLLVLEQKKKESNSKNRAKGSIAMSQNFKAKRASYRDAVDSSSVTVLDRFMAGLYWGEGAKSSKRWRISNMDVQVLRVAMAWAQQHGQESEGFKIRVSVPAYLNSNHALIQDYWSQQLHLPSENVLVYDTVQRKVEKQYKREYFGSASLESIGNGTELFEVVMKLISLCKDEALASTVGNEMRV